MEERKEKKPRKLKLGTEVGLVRIDEKMIFKFTEEEKQKILSGRQERATKSGSVVPQKAESYYCLADKVKYHKTGKELFSNVELRLCKKVPSGDYLVYAHWFVEVDDKKKPIDNPMALVAHLIPVSSILTDEESFEVYNR